MRCYILGSLIVKHLRRWEVEEEVAVPHFYFSVIGMHGDNINPRPQRHFPMLLPSNHSRYRTLLVGLRAQLPLALIRKSL